MFFYEVLFLVFFAVAILTEVSLGRRGERSCVTESRGLELERRCRVVGFEDGGWGYESRNAVIFRFGKSWR